MLRKSCTSGSEGGCWKSALYGNSLASYPTGHAWFGGGGLEKRFFLKRSSLASYPTSSTVLKSSRGGRPSRLTLTLGYEYALFCLFNLPLRGRISTRLETLRLS